MDKQINIKKFPEPLRRVLKAEAATRGITMYTLIIGILQKYVEGK